MSKLDQMSEQEKKELLEDFLEAPLEKSFGQEAVALFLKCSTHTLQAMRCNGSSLPYSKVGRCVAYQKADVLAYQASKKVFNTAQLARAS